MGVLLSSKVCPKVKIFDFSADNVHQPDTNDMHTGATLDVGLLPESPFAQHSWSVLGPLGRHQQYSRCLMMMG